MFYVKIGISHLSAAELVLKTGVIIEAMTGNVNFTTPNPAIAVIETARDDLGAAIVAAFNRDHVKIELRDTQEEILRNLLNLLSSYVQNTSQGDKNIILSSGFEVRKTPEPVGIPVQVINLRANPTTGSGELQLIWKRVKGAKSYAIEMMDLGFSGSDDTAQWVPAPTVTAAKLLLSSLNSGHMYRIRVAAIGAAGQGSWSDIAENRCK